MATNISLFDYNLPKEFIAQSPAEPRDSSRLLIMDRAMGELAHKTFSGIIDELTAGDVLVFNMSKVFKARLLAPDAEMFVLRVRDGEIDALLRPGKKFAVGDVIPAVSFYDGRAKSDTGVQPNFTVKEKHEDGVVVLTTERSTEAMLKFCESHGAIPTPPYMEQGVDEAQYQTVYAKEVGSVAAPTAGLHFTPELIVSLRNKGVQIEEVTLHVGLGTFRPVQSTTLEEHVMHSEWVSVSKETAECINAAKAEGRRIIAVGTTTVRVLEGIAAQQGKLMAYEGEVNMFITPGFTFAIIDALITNFHLPKSTLLVLVSAFAGREHVLAVYEAAKREGYRFFSFGDAMFIR